MSSHTSPETDAKKEYDAVPTELQDRPQWLLWDANSDTPRRPHWNGDFGISWPDPTEWHTFEDAVEAAKTRDSWGIGYVTALDNDDYPRGMYGVLDLDGCLREAFEDKPKEWLPSLESFTESEAYIEYSPSGTGLHIPVVGHDAPEWWSDSQFEDRDHEGVDYLTNKFVAFTGDPIDASGTEVTETDPTPFLFESYQRINGEAPRIDSEPDSTQATTQDEWLTEDDVTEALDHINPDVDHKQWIRLGYAVHDFDSGPTGRKLFEQWSKTGEKYDEQAKRQIAAIWENGTQGGDVTVGTLVHHAKEGGWTPSRGSSPTGSSGRKRSKRPATDAISAEWFDPDEQVVTVHSTEDYDSDELVELFKNPDDLPADLTRTVDETDGGSAFLDAQGEWTVREAAPTGYDRFADMTTQELKNAVLESVPTDRLAWLPDREQWLWCSEETNVWKDHGEEHLRQWLDDYLGPHYSRHVRNEVMDQLKARTRRRGQEFGGGPQGTIAVENGVVNLSDGTLERSIEPSDCIRWTLSTRFDPDATCPQWKVFLGDVAEPSDIELLQEFVGYTLHHWGIPFKKALMLFGPTDAGKSVFLDVINALFGGEHSEARSNTSIQYFANQRWGEARLVNTPVNVRSDLPDKTIENTGKVKELIAGDMLDAERKHKPVFQFRPTTKHIYSANRAPNRSVDDEAFWNRWVTVIFPQAVPKAEQDSSLIDRLTDELPGILNWAIEGYQRLMDQEGFSGGIDPYQNREKWERYGNSIEQWIERFTETDPEGFIPKRTTGDRLGAYDSYKAFARNNGLEVERPSKFTSELKRRDGVNKTQRRVDDKRPRGYSGLRLTEDAPQPHSADKRESESEEQQKGVGAYSG